MVLNAKTVEDVQFFYSLGINLNDINTFISKVITIIFSLLLLIETILLVIVLFKLLLTKKDNKPRRVRYFIISAVLLFVTF
ncbi:MAG: hypothetical protein H6767_04880 [Candidatus Peribacteria bacterium]|nr:MAG: hypothetical protein H6767_04880 [Candidatus Peribacteria bacterium]